jgi:hypothetical protein
MKTLNKNTENQIIEEMEEAKEYFEYLEQSNCTAFEIELEAATNHEYDCEF